MRFALTNSLTGLPDTNSFLVWKVGDPILANGGVTTTGLPVRYRPDTNGIVLTNMLAPGNYLATNAALGRGIVFRAFNDNSSTVWNVFEGPPTGLAISGYNTFNAGFFTADAIEWLATNSFNGNLSATNDALLAAIAATNNANLIITTNLITAATNNGVARAELLATNTANLIITTNLDAATQANLVASNAVLAARIIATNTANLIITTNLNTTERTVMLATNTANLIITTNLNTTERTVMLATNTANLIITTNLVTAQNTALIAATNVSLATAKAYTLTIGGYGSNNVQAAALRLTNNVTATATRSTNYTDAVANTVLIAARSYTNQFPLSSLKTMPGTNNETREWIFLGQLDSRSDTYFGNPALDYILANGTFSIGHGTIIGDTSGILEAVGLTASGNIYSGGNIQSASGFILGNGSRLNLGEITNAWRADIAATNGTSVAATNGTAFNLTIGTNLDFSPGFTTIQLVTNIIGVVGFAQPNVDGTYVLQSSGTLTNNLNGTNSLFQTGGSWYLQSNGVTLFALSGNHPVGNSWSLVNGTGTIGQTIYGVRFNVNGWLMEGTLTSTNLDARIRAQIGTGAVTNGDTRAITLGNTNNVFYGTFNGASTSTATNAQYLLGVYGTAYMQTNTQLYPTQIRTNGAFPNYVIGFDGATVAWVTNAGGGGSFSGNATTLSTDLTNWVNTQASAYSLDATNGLRTDIMARLAAATNAALTLATNNDLAIGLAGSNNVQAAALRLTNNVMVATNTLFTAFKAGTNVLAQYVRDATNGLTSGGGGSATNLTPWPTDIDANGHKLSGASAVYGQESDNTFYIGSDDTSTFAANSSQVVLKTGDILGTVSGYPGSFWISPGSSDNLGFAGSVIIGKNSAYDSGIKGTNAFYGTNFFHDPIIGTDGTFVNLNATNMAAYNVGASAYYLNGVPVFTNSPSGTIFYVTNASGLATNFNGIYYYSGQSYGFASYTNTIHTNYYFYNSWSFNYLSTNTPLQAAAYGRQTTVEGYYAVYNSSQWATNEPLVSIYSAGSGTAYTGTFTGNGAGLTNVYGPTVSYVVTNLDLDKQTIYLTGAGTTAVNGRYVLQTPTNVYLTYYSAEWTNSAGTGWTLAWNTIYSGKYTVTNASDLGDNAYEATTISQWTEDLSGASPPPSGSFSNVFSYVTNTVIVTTNKQFYSMVNNKTFLVDGYAGHDSNPWPAPKRTLLSVFSNVITSDSIVLIGAGTVSNLNAGPSFNNPAPNNSHIVGMGKDVSTIYGGVWVGTNMTLQDFSTSGDGQIFNYQINSLEVNTNLGGLKMRNLNVNGAVDGLFIRNFWLTLLAENCDFNSGFDAVNYPNTTNNGNAANATLIGCTFNVLGSSSVNRGYSVYTTNTLHKFYGGQFNVTNSFNANPAYGLALYNGAKAEVYGAVFNVTNSFAGGVSSAIFTTNNSDVSGYWWENGVFRTSSGYSTNSVNTTWAVAQWITNTSGSFENYIIRFEHSGTATARSLDVYVRQGGITNIYPWGFPALTGTATNFVSFRLPKGGRFAVTNTSNIAARGYDKFVE